MSGRDNMAQCKPGKPDTTSPFTRYILSRVASPGDSFVETQLRACFARRGRESADCAARTVAPKFVVHWRLFGAGRERTWTRGGRVRPWGARTRRRLRRDRVMYPVKCGFAFRHSGFHVPGHKMTDGTKR